MAYFGLSKPIIAPWTADNTYAAGQIFQCGKLTATNVTPNSKEGSLYADNGLAEYVKEFTDADISATIDKLPVAAATILFGHTASGTGSNPTVTHKADDSSPYVGYGFVVDKIESNVKKYQACILCKVKFSEGAQDFTTKGDSISFGTPAISGKAVAQESDKAWKIVSPDFSTAAEAYNWILTQFGGGSADPGTYSAVSTPAANSNPAAEGWYVRTGASGSYVYYLTGDTVLVNGTTYYERSAA